MNKLLVGLNVVLGVIIAVWVGGVRVVILQPIGEIPEGVTVVFAGLRGANLLDSPDAICKRSVGGVSDLCRAAAMAELTRQGVVLLRLPYSPALFRATL